MEPEQTISEPTEAAPAEALSVTGDVTFTEPTMDGDLAADGSRDESWMDAPAPGIDDADPGFEERRKESRAFEFEDADDDAQESTEEAPATEVEAKEAEVDAEDATPPVRSEWVDSVSSLIGSNLASDEEAIDRIRSMKDENEGFGQLRELLSGNEKMGEFFRAMLEDEMTPEEAAAASFDSLSLLTPDPYDDPDAYARYMKNKGREEAEAQFQEQSKQTQQKRIERAKSDLSRSLKAFQEKHEMSDAQITAFQQRFALYRLGDPDDGRMPTDVFEREYRADNYEADVRKAREEGLAQGRNEAIKNLTGRRGQRGDSIPALTGARTPVKEISAEAAKSQSRRRNFANDGSFDHSWPPK